MLAYQSLEAGLAKVELDEARLEEDLHDAWEVLAEAVQTVMRAHGIPDAYDRLKAFTRGRPVDEHAVREFIDSLDLPAGREGAPARPRAPKIPRDCTASGAAARGDRPSEALLSAVRNVTQLARSGQAQTVVSNSKYEVVYTSPPTSN